MAEDTGFSQNNSTGPGFLALLNELQSNFYEIARFAELASERSLTEVQARAEMSLRLIDGCLMGAQIEAGQTALALRPYGVGSVMHEAAHELRKLNGASVSIGASVNKPAMTDPLMLQNMLYAAGSALGEATGSPLEIRSFSVAGSGIGVGVFSQDFSLTAGELREALAKTGSTYMPLSKHSSKSGVLILLADTLARTLGSGLEMKTVDKMRGFATVLPLSKQLSLV